MNNDSLYALGVLVFFVSVLSRQQFCGWMLEMLLKLTRSGATVLLLAIVAYVFSKGMTYTALALSLVVIYLLKDLWTNWIRSDARRLHLDIGRDIARFDPSTSVDLQWANGDVSHDKPKMLGKDVASNPLLLFPPTAEVLYQLNGSS